MTNSTVLFLYGSSKFLRDCSVVLRDHCKVYVVNSLETESIEEDEIDMIVADYSVIDGDSSFLSRAVKFFANCRFIIVADEIQKLNVNQFRQLDFQIFQLPVTVREVTNYIFKQLVAGIKNKKHQRVIDSSPYEIVQTLHGVLSLVNPVAYNVGVQLDRFVSIIIEKLEMEDRQEYHSAALLSHIGCIAVEHDVIINSISQQEVDEYSKNMYRMHTELGQRLLDNIPMLNDVARIVGLQNRDYNKFSANESPIVSGGAQMLKVAAFMHANYFKDDLNQRMYNVLCENKGIYNKKMLMVFVDYKITPDDTFVTSLRLKELEPFMILEEPVYNVSGLLLMAGGLELNSMSLERLRKFSSTVKEPIKVRCSMKLAKESAD